MKHLLLAALVPLLWAAPALAAPGPNLGTTIAPPPPTFVDTAGRYTVTVANTGNQHAPGVQLTLDLPATHTSPQVYVLGVVSGYGLLVGSGSCGLAGTRITCTLGQVNKNTSKTIYVDLALPQNTGPLILAAAATTTGNDTNPANNDASHTATVVYRDVTAGPAGDAFTRLCSGTGLTAFFECELFPSSIMTFDAVYHPDHTITFPTEPGYSGTWSQTGANQLTAHFFDGATEVATFHGDGVTSSCFEGLTTFPPPPPTEPVYVAPYQICFTAP